MTNKIDFVLLGTVLILVFFGLIMVYSASAIFSEKAFNDDPFHVFKNQLTWTILGLSILFITIFIPTKLFNRFAWVLFGVTLLLLIMVFIPNFGTKILGAKRWVRIGGFGFQPSELAKLTIIILFAKLFKNPDTVNDLKKSFLPGLGILVLLTGLIIFEPDFGTAVEIFMIGVIIMFISGVKWIYLFNIGTVTVPAVISLILFAGYRKERILAFLDPGSLATTSGYQILQSLIAVGSGGVTGLGLGNSVQKLFFLPQAHSDYIFAIIGEELGLLGALLVIGLFLTLFIKGFKIGKKSREPFTQLIAYGISFHIILQVFMNIGITLGLLPPKGLPLPFFSAGGSSLIITLLEIGILLRISLENELGRQYGR